MTPREELALVSRWRRFRVGKPISNKSLLEFYVEEVQPDPRLRQYNAFEVLDSITNAGASTAQMR